MHRNDEQGKSAQSICERWLDLYCRNGRPIFEVQFLGDKFEAVDYYVELKHMRDIKCFFFVQVKSTTTGYTKRLPRRLRIDIKGGQVHNLLKIQVPTYIVGVDLSTPPSNELNPAYIIYANNISQSRIRSISTQYSLDKVHAGQTLETLWTEVKLFWESHDITTTSSLFSDGELL